MAWRSRMGPGVLSATKALTASRASAEATSPIIMNMGTNRVVPANHIPWVLFHLPQTERNPLILFRNFYNYSIDLLSNFNNLTRFVDTFCPRHFCDMNQPFNTIIYINECPIRHHINYLAMHN